MVDMLVKSDQRGAGRRFDDGAFGIVAGKGVDRFQRLPQRNGKELDMIWRLPPQQPGAAIAVKSGQ